MNVEVRLFATLREGRGKKVYFQLKAGLTPRIIIKELNIQEEDIAILLINGRDGDFDRPLMEGDYLSIFPPVGGG
ncbi:MoaD/ThiS family protein [Anaeromicrobium sediminis]|uniref:Molybdopterin synthase sulfur carrier subunit n=1 Tax=Anaeromicrobium sediminis TaxID=1478221 RepID=A0A267MK08_9FIRM|nr:MoaD/ThiS family protein [Anaeromicrobium sediminis]PAB59866.1 molybdopterin synthase sulfur carrier subunit [Anaeromicrobium sediminis]